MTQAPMNTSETFGVLLLTAGAFTSSLSTPAEAAVPRAAELARGEHIARLVCAACHVVARDQEYPPILTVPTPNFVDIANRPGVSAQSLQRFVTNTHWDGQKLPVAMPNLMMNKDDVQAVAQYILSLRTR
jgi:mono/diheme cytochrome c family protein